MEWDSAVERTQRIETSCQYKVRVLGGIRSVIYLHNVNFVLSLRPRDDLPSPFASTDLYCWRIRSSDPRENLFNSPCRWQLRRTSSRRNAPAKSDTAML